MCPYWMLRKLTKGQNDIRFNINSIWILPICCRTWEASSSTPSPPPSCSRRTTTSICTDSPSSLSPSPQIDVQYHSKWIKCLYVVIQLRLPSRPFLASSASAASCLKLFLVQPRYHTVTACHNKYRIRVVGTVGTQGNQINFFSLWMLEITKI